MKKKIMLALSLLCLVALLCVLASCGHEHSAASEWKNDEANHWNACSVEGEECSEKLNSAAHTFESNITAATCTATGLKVETCTVCGYVKETVLAVAAHDYADATCTEPKTCNDCGATDGEALGHDEQYDVIDPTCTEDGYTAITCSRCDYTSTKDPVDALGHKGGEATCTEPAYCDVCYQPYGEALGHKGGKADCITKATCGVCGEKYGEYGEHGWVNATCMAPKHCSICQAEQGVPADHTGGEATCTEAAICEFCNQPYGDPAGHKGGTATCTEAAVCTVCNESYGAPAGHKGGTANCSQGPVCDVCGEPYGAAEGVHSSKNGVCEACGKQMAILSAEKIESATTSHEGTGGAANANKLFDGDKTSTGIYTVGDKEYSPNAVGDELTIVFTEAVYLNEVLVWQTGNWSYADVYFYDENGNQCGKVTLVLDNILEGAGNSAVKSLKPNVNVQIKSVKIVSTGLKWGSGKTSKISEIEFVTNTTVEE